MNITDLKKRLFGIFSESNTVRAIVFGSYASGQQDHHSDIDIMIIAETSKRFLDRFDDFTEIYEVLPDHTVDILVYTPNELSKYADRPFVKTILQKGKVIYERNKKPARSAALD